MLRHANNLLRLTLLLMLCVSFAPFASESSERPIVLAVHPYLPFQELQKRYEPLADYLEKVMIRITYVGAAFLALVAIVPILVNIQLGVPFSVASFYGGTGLLIAVSVAFDLVQKIDSHLVMRDYPGLLEG